MAEAAAKGGTDAIMVGGSVGAAGILLHETVEQIKKKTDLPVILFPSSVAGLCENADAVFFMSLLNSRSTCLYRGEPGTGCSIDPALRSGAHTHGLYHH